MTLDKVRALLLHEIHSTSLREWCEAHGVSATHTSEFLSGKRGPSPGLLDALNLEWRVSRKPPRVKRKGTPRIYEN